MGARVHIRAHICFHIIFSLYAYVKFDECFVFCIFRCAPLHAYTIWWNYYVFLFVSFVIIDFLSQFIIDVLQTALFDPDICD